ncbi:MAG TPA: mechanosensitive ion channel family protein [Pyrinomonadaceae bacterium]|nr:mechanosensitive ion channel family protein [Pyrinomonadaceae bacterium]
MKRPRLQKRLALPAVAALFFLVARYFIQQISPDAIAGSFMSRPRNAYEWAYLVATLALLVSAAFIVVRALNEFVFFLFRKRKGYEAPSLARDIFSLAAYVICFALILRLVFPDLSFGALLSGSALLGIILGLALQDTLGNLFAGISLHADRPFQVGDVIVVGQFTGVVESITWRAVKIRTFSNHVVLIGNTNIARESIEVCPRDNANARLVFFNTLYTDSPAKVIEVVREAVRECDNVLRYMTPNVRIRGLGADGPDYEVKYWLEDYARYNDTDALVRQRIWYAFQRHGLNFAYPTRTLYVERPSRSDGDGLRDRIAERLRAVEIFSPLTEQQLARLAENTERYVFAPGEAIIREGDEGSSMFVVHRGRVEVQVKDGGRSRVVNTLGEGKFFGEMALLTGEPRTANVVAAEETEVLEIGHRALRRLFETNPELVESLTQTVARRRVALDARPEATEMVEKEKAGLLVSIRRFFRLD